MQLIISSQEGFTLRKQGRLEEAYAVAQELINHAPSDIWHQRLFVYVTLDLIKKEIATQKQSSRLGVYTQQLQALYIEPRPENESLIKQRNYALSLVSPINTLLKKAKELSEKGLHGEASREYFKIHKEYPDDEKVQTAFAWELYRLAKSKLSNDFNITHFKKYFDFYFSLSFQKTEPLHHCWLNIALKIKKHDHPDAEQLDFSDFMLRWELNSLLTEDFLANKTEGGKEWPPLALTVFRQICHDGIHHNNRSALDYAIPYILKALNCHRFKTYDITWLIWDLSKVSHFLGKTQDALNFAMQIAKLKNNEAWLWDHIAELYASSDTNLAKACLCKALLCNPNLGFTYKIKLKLAQLLISECDFARAKTEISQVVEFKKEQNEKIPDFALQETEKNWFIQTEASLSNAPFYRNHATTAECLLYEDLPWIKAILGEVFSYIDKHQKEIKKRKIFVCLDSSNIPFEVSIPEKRISLSDKVEGTPIKIKGEFQANNFQLYTLQPREDGELWDILPTSDAIIDHINTQKSLAHLIITQKIHFNVPLNELPEGVALFDALTLKISAKRNKEGSTVYQGRAFQKANHRIERLLRPFEESVIFASTFAKLTNDIFVPQNLVQQYNITENTESISGLAILSHDKRHDSWGWKAIKITNVS